MSQKRISEAITGWYSNMLHSSSNESLRQTFDQAKAAFSAELTHDECKRIWIANQTSYFVDYWKVEILWVDILRALVLQAIQINPQALVNGVYPLNIRHLREASDELDWLLILQRALQGVKRIFIMLDADLIGHATAGDKFTATKCLEMLNQKLTSTNTKIIITRSVVQEAYVREHWDPGSWSNLQISNIGGTFQRRKQRRRRL